MGVIDQRVLSNAVEIALEALFVIDNFHTPTAKNKRRPHQYRVADTSCDLDRLSQIGGGAICRRDKTGVVKNSLEGSALLSLVDGLRCCAKNWNTSSLKTVCEPQGRLTSQLHHNSQELARLALGMDDLEDIL